MASLNKVVAILIFIGGLIVFSVCDLFGFLFPLTNAAIIVIAIVLAAIMVYTPFQLHVLLNNPFARQLYDTVDPGNPSKTPLHVMTDHFKLVWQLAILSLVFLLVGSTLQTHYSRFFEVWALALFVTVIYYANFTYDLQRRFVIKSASVASTM